MKERGFLRGKCNVSLDDYKREVWPTRFVEIPRKGDFVKSRSGKTLKVTYVTHTSQHTPIYPDRYNSEIPIIEIELHRRS